MAVRKTTEVKKKGKSRPKVDITRASSGPAWRRYLRALGPGLVTGASDDDPSGIGTYAQAGAKLGFGLLWTAFLTLPLMAGIQEICDRTALATGQDLGNLITKRFAGFGRKLTAVLLGALIVANALNISADLVAVGEGAHLLHAGPPWVWALVSGVAISALLIAGSFEMIARVFKILVASLLAYLGVLVVAKVPWGKVLFFTFVPHISLSKDYLTLLVAVLGTTISPYLFFWQSAHRIEEMRDEDEGGDRPAPLKERSGPKARAKLKESRLDVFSGMTFSNLVMFAIIVATAATIGSHGHHDIQGAAEAASALKPVAGPASEVLFALGLIGAGALAVPVLAGSGSAGLAGLLGKRWGFSRSPRQAPVFYGLVALGTLGGTLLTFMGINPIKLLVIVALVNGLAAAPFLIVVMLISNNDKIMGSQVNGRLANFIGWLTVGLMSAAALTLIATGGGS